MLKVIDVEKVYYQFISQHWNYIKLAWFLTMSEKDNRKINKFIFIFPLVELHLNVKSKNDLAK